MLRKVLVANCGEITIRAFRAAYELGVRTIPVHPLDERTIPLPEAEGPSKRARLGEVLRGLRVPEVSLRYPRRRSGGSHASP
jgi:hypothetical protein